MSFSLRLREALGASSGGSGATRPVPQPAARPRLLGVGGPRRLLARPRPRNRPLPRRRRRGNRAKRGSRNSSIDLSLIHI
eukprot:7537541-Alexandrium_andersonii.AAC.1